MLYYCDSQSAKSKNTTANQKRRIDIRNTNTLPIIWRRRISNITKSIQITNIERDVVICPNSRAWSFFAEPYEYMKFEVIGAITISPTKRTRVSNCDLSMVETSLRAKI